MPKLTDARFQEEFPGSTLTPDQGPFRATRVSVGSIQRWGRGLLAAGVFAGLAALVTELWGGGASFGFVLPVAPRLVGLGLMALGAVLTLVAQVEMGASWRVGLDPSEVTSLVTTGPFRLVRNPIFAAIVVIGLGVLLVALNIIAVFAVAASLAGAELQVRRVEEPYLIRVHGERYLSYARRVGRFVPRVGRIGAMP
jgi:protein-S-isoprenylcysteine O-methyltransferase Ste14